MSWLVRATLNEVNLLPHAGDHATHIRSIPNLGALGARMLRLGVLLVRVSPRAGAIFVPPIANIVAAYAFWIHGHVDVVPA